MIKLKPLILSIVITLGLAGIVSFAISGSMEVYGAVEKPPLSPPQIVFPIVWSILYLLMAVSAYIVYIKREDGSRKELTIYAVQLAVNLIWPILFFNMQAFKAAFFWLILLIVLVAVMIRAFYKVSRPAGYIQIPYLIWCVFAAYLNLGIWLMN